MATHSDTQSFKMPENIGHSVEVEKRIDPEANHGETQQSIIIDPEREKALM